MIPVRDYDTEVRLLWQLLIAIAALVLGAFGGYWLAMYVVERV